MNPQTPQTDDRKVNLTFTVTDINTILASLQELPHRVSDPIIKSLIEQVQPQIQQGQPKEVQLPSDTDPSAE